MEPANRIIESLGGPSRVARLLGIHRVTVSKWKLPKESGGTGGSIPFDRAPALIDLARGQGVDLTAADFLPSRPEDAA